FIEHGRKTLRICLAGQVPVHLNFTESLKYKFIQGGYYAVIFVIVGVKPRVAKSISELVIMSLGNWPKPFQPLFSSSHSLGSLARLKMVGSNKDDVLLALGRLA